MLIPNGKLYLAAINDRHLTLKALDMALRRRCPEAGLLHRSDRGSTYASEDYQAVLIVRSENPVASRGPTSTEGRMRKWMSFVLVTVAMTACHPRYAPIDEGGGGSGGLDSIRARILASIAARNYDQAREYLKLAANMADDEQARFEQMISAAERGLVPFLEKALPHIFRAKPGHFAQDTAAARELIQATVTEANFVGLRERGSLVYQRILDTGVQIWVHVRDGTIRNAGYNDVARSAVELLKVGD